MIDAKNRIYMLQRVQFIMLFTLFFLVSNICNEAYAHQTQGVVVIPIITKGEGDATAADVLFGKTFSNTQHSGLVGTLPNIGQHTIEPTNVNITIPKGYHDGTGLIVGDANLTSANIKSGVTIFGTTGTPNVVDTSSGNASASDILFGKVAWVDGEALTGTAIFLLPKTGQTSTYIPGDDGDIQSGQTWPGPRFTDNGNSTVTDNLTGIIWRQDANTAGAGNWSDAITSCNTMNFTNETDWRLPNVLELQSLLDFSQFSPVLPSLHPFTNVQNDFYWTGTTHASDTSTAWAIHFGHGEATWTAKSLSTRYTWCCR